MPVFKRSWLTIRLKEMGTEQNLDALCGGIPVRGTVNLSQVSIRVESLSHNSMQEFFHVIRTPFSVRV